MGHVLIQVCGKSCQGRQDGTGKCGVGVAKTHNDSAKSGVSSRVGSDQTAELDAQRLNYYQRLVGVLRWICELGRVDILMTVSLMSRYLVSAKEGHLQQ
jgi:hypothetical protein